MIVCFFLSQTFSKDQYFLDLLNFVDDVSPHGFLQSNCFTEKALALAKQLRALYFTIVLTKKAPPVVFFLQIKLQTSLAICFDETNVESSLN